MDCTTGVGDAVLRCCHTLLDENESTLILPNLVNAVLVSWVKSHIRNDIRVGGGQHISRDLLWSMLSFNP